MHMEFWGIEFMAAAQALDFREFMPGTGVRKAKEVVRRHIARLIEDMAVESRPHGDEGSCKIVRDPGRS